MKQLFSLIVAVLSIVVLAAFVMKLGFVLFELAVLMLLVVILFLSFITKRNKMMMLMLYGLSLSNIAYLYLSGPANRQDDIYLIGLLSLIGFFFELGRAEVIRIPRRERARLMRKWGMQKIQPIEVDEEIEAANELQEELKRSRDEIRKELAQTKKDHSRTKAGLEKSQEKTKAELEKAMRKLEKDFKKELKKSKSGKK